MNPLTPRNAWALLAALTLPLIPAHALYGAMHDMNAAAIAMEALEFE